MVCVASNVKEKSLLVICWGMGKNTLRNVTVLALGIGWGLGRRTQVPRSLQSEVSAAGCGRTALHSWVNCCPLTPVSASLPGIIHARVGAGVPGWSRRAWVLAAFWAWKVFRASSQRRNSAVHLPCSDETLVFKMVNQFSFSSPAPPYVHLGSESTVSLRLRKRFWNWLGVTFEIVRNFPGVCGLFSFLKALIQKDARRSYLSYSKVVLTLRYQCLVFFWIHLC